MANRMEQAVMDNDKRALNREINAIPYIASTTKRPKSAVPMSPWGRYGHRDTGTLAHIEKKRLELAGMAPTPQITWSPSNIPTPPWASPGGVRGRPASAPARGPPVYRMPPPSPPRPAPPRPSSPQARPSSPRPRPPPVESPWSVEAAAAEWTCNRGGGGCWSKAPVMSGTMAHIEKKRLELSATAPAPNLTRWPRPHSASRATGERGEGDGSPERSRSPQSSRYAAKAVSEYAHDATQARPELWRPLDLSALRLADLTQLQFLLSDPAAMEACGASRFPRAVPVEPPPAALDDEAEHAPATASRRPQRERYRRLAEVEAAPPVEAPPPEPMVRFEARSVTLSKNRLSNIEELPRLLSTLVLLDAPSLTLLDLSFNQIVRLPAALGLLRSLEVLKLNNNQLDHLEDLTHLLPLARLNRLTLMHNPLIMQRLPSLARLALRQEKPDLAATSSLKELEFEYNAQAYRLRVLARLPHLRQLDSMSVTAKERREAPRHSKGFGQTRPAHSPIG